VSIILATVWTLVYTAEARRQIDALTGKARRQVEKALEQLACGDRRGKALRGELRGILSERVGNFRILYRGERRRLIILVLAVVHRRLAYGGH
jgi:mRNA-degrading endonuclease RelE of RelBE toxin-antitoxin system